MSLGPPFDASNQRLHLLLGAVTALLLLFLVAVALLLADHTLGKSLTVHLLVHRSGQLYVGAEVQLAGERIGELTAIRRFRPRAGDPKELQDREPLVEMELRIVRRAGGRLPKNATFLARNPTLLSPAVIEVGPPESGAHKDVPLSDGDYLIGIDPPDLDQLLSSVYLSVEAILREARELRPDWEEAVAAFSALSQRINRVSTEGQVARIGLHGQQTLQLLRGLRRRLDAAGLVTMPATLATLQTDLEPLISQATQLGHKTELLQDRVGELLLLFGPRRRRDLDESLRGFRAAVSSSQRAAEDAQFLVRYFESGRGTLGGFQRDIQIFDELKEVHRILKQQLHRVIVKPRKPAQ